MVRMSLAAAKTAVTSQTTTSGAIVTLFERLATEIQRVAASGPPTANTLENLATAIKSEGASFGATIATIASAQYSP